MLLTTPLRSLANQLWCWYSWENWRTLHSYIKKFSLCALYICKDSVNECHRCWLVRLFSSPFLHIKVQFILPMTQSQDLNYIKSWKVISSLQHIPLWNVIDPAGYFFGINSETISIYLDSLVAASFPFVIVRTKSPTSLTPLAHNKRHSLSSSSSALLTGTPVEA